MRPEETFDYHIQFSWFAISRMYNQIAATHGLTRAMGYVLMIIDEKKGTAATQIGPLLGMEPTGLTRLFRSLERKGLICRSKGQPDQRKVMVCLTKEGKKKRKIARSVVRKFNNRIISALGEKEFTTFKLVIGKANVVVDEFRAISIDKNE